MADLSAPSVPMVPPPGLADGGVVSLQMERRLLSILLALLTVLTFTSSAGLAATTPGVPAPALGGTQLDGAPVRPASYAGKVVVINFWATWCPPCRAETSDVIAAYRRLHARDVAFLGIDTTENAAVVRAFVSAKNVPYPIAIADRAAYDAFGISYIPTTIVLDGGGIVRARWVGGVTPAQLQHYVAAARRRQNAEWVTPAQAKIDGLIASVHLEFSSSTATTATLARIDHTLATVDTLADQNEASVDFERTSRESGALRVAAGEALRSSTDPTLHAKAITYLRRGYADIGRHDLVVELARAEIDEHGASPQAVRAYALALYRNHQYEGLLEQAQLLTRLTPDDGDAWSLVGLGYQRVGHPELARFAYETSLDRAIASFGDAPSQDELASIADGSLDLADIDASLGDPERAQVAYDQAARYGAKLDPKHYAELRRNILERTQEGTIAASLVRADGKSALSIAPWTGPDLPGSIASTLKYRLIVAARADTDITLNATGLAAHWIGSFCGDGLCSPQTVTFHMPATGVKTFEFQLVPPAPHAVPGPVGIMANDGTAVRLP